MDDDARAAYNAQLEVALQDEEDDYTGEPLSKWIPTTNPNMAKNEDPAENRAVFVVSAGLLGDELLGAVPYPAELSKYMDSTSAT